MRVSFLVAPPVTVEFAESDYDVAEGGTQTVTVELSADPERTVTIPIVATGQDGATDADYSVPAGVTFNAGETSKTITFVATQDDLDDDDETVKLEFGTMPDAYVTAGTTDETVVSIEDDDDPAVTVQFGQAAYTVAESDDSASTTEETENEVEVTVTLSADPERTITIPVTSTGSDGATGDDYSVAPASVTFDAGETSKTVTFTATARHRGRRRRAREAGVRDHARRAGDDRPHRRGHRQHHRRRPSPREGAVRAGHLSHQRGADRQRHHHPGRRPRAHRRDPHHEDQPERRVRRRLRCAGQRHLQRGRDAEDHRLHGDARHGQRRRRGGEADFGTMPDRVTAGTRTETLVKIVDDDLPEVTVAFSQSAYTVAEGATRVVTVTVSKDPERTIIIPIDDTLQGTASASPTTPACRSSVTFTDGGSTSQTFTFMATQDLIDDDGESVKLEFGTMPDPRVSAGATDELTLTIDDDDTAAVVLSPTSLTLDEEDAAGAVYTVALATEPTVDVTVTVSGHAGTDLTLTSVKLVGDELELHPRQLEHAPVHHADGGPRRRRRTKTS